jgi:LmbE family N-acetylglucosaminyl deacetylase
VKKTVLVVAAHPDDEVLGCGATMAKHSRQGDEVHVYIMAEGLTSRDPKRNIRKHSADLSKLASAARKAHAILGITKTTLGAFPDNRMDSLPLLDVVKAVEAVIAEIRPDTVYTHHAGDLNVDHRVIHQAVVTATRPLPGSGLESLLFFEVPSSTEWQAQTAATAFIPNWFEDASETLDVKLKALKAYAMEMRPWPHARSLEAVEFLARWRGANAGWEAAEAFMLGRRRST